MEYRHEYNFNEGLIYKIGLLTSKSDDTSHAQIPIEASRHNLNALVVNTDRSHNKYKGKDYSNMIDSIKNILKTSMKNDISYKIDFSNYFDEEDMKWMGQREQMFYRFRNIQKYLINSERSMKLDNQKTLISMSGLNQPAIENSPLPRFRRDADTPKEVSKSVFQMNK